MQEDRSHQILPALGKLPVYSVGRPSTFSGSGRGLRRGRQAVRRAGDSQHTTPHPVPFPTAELWENTEKRNTANRAEDNCLWLTSSGQTDRRPEGQTKAVGLAALGSPPPQVNASSPEGPSGKGLVCIPASGKVLIGSC